MTNDQRSRIEELFEDCDASDILWELAICCRRKHFECSEENWLDDFLKIAAVIEECANRIEHIE